MGPCLANAATSAAAYPSTDLFGHKQHEIKVPDRGGSTYLNLIPVRKWRSVFDKKCHEKRNEGGKM